MDSILLYQNVGTYFFSGCKNFAFPVLKNSIQAQKSYYSLRGFGWSFLTSFSYGSWTKLLPNLKEVFILDSAFDKSLPTFIKSQNPMIKMNLIFWNPIKENEIKILKQFNKYGKISSYNKKDCEKYGLELIEAFYSKEYASTFCSKDQNDRIIFLGRDKGRSKTLSVLSCYLNESGIETRFLILNHDKGSPSRGLTILNEELPYDAYCQQVANSSAILDIAQADVNALNLRVMESLFFQKKLITNNSDIKEYSFYDPNNICILDDLNDKSKIKDFMKKPFTPYPETLLNHYDIYTVLKDKKSNRSLHRATTP